MLNIQLQYFQFNFILLKIINLKTKLVNLINLDKPNTKYLIPILLLNYKHNINYKLVNLINLDKPNPKYLAPIYPILNAKNK